MSHDSDPAPLDGLLPRVRVTREIPLWGIVSMLLAFAGQAVALYYGQQEQAREMKRWSDRQAEMASDIRSILSESQKESIKRVELTFAVGGLEQRVRQLEARPIARER